MKTSSIVGSVAVLLLLVGCSNKLSKDKLETGVKSAYAKQHVNFKSVTCPADREVKAGDKFECTGELDEGTKATVSVVQKDDKGSVSFDILGNVFTEAYVSEFVSKKAGGKVEAKCPKKVAILRKGETLTCDATDDGAKGKISITAESDEKANFKWEFEGKAVAPPVTADAEEPVGATGE